MSDFHFVLVSLDSKSDRDTSDFIKILNKANDWIEFRERTWLVWTKQSSKVWYQRLKPTLEARDNLFIAAVDISDRGGWMPKAFWEFVRDKTTSS